MGKGSIFALLRSARAWLGHALLVAFVLRAIIPAGFMPTYAAGHDGGFKIVICTANGLELVNADADGDPAGGTAAKHASEPCAFSSLASLAVPAELPSSQSLFELASAVVPPARDVTLPPPRAGPAVGSRAPPIFL